MIGIILAFGAVAILGVAIPYISESYGSQLERYIVSHNPKDAADVERLTLEFQEKQNKNFL